MVIYLVEHFEKTQTSYLVEISVDITRGLKGYC